MKQIFKYILAFAALSLAVASCVKEAPHPVGEPDEAGCYGVYFPAQLKSAVFDPTDPTTTTISVSRKNSKGAITVPLTIKDPNKVFQVSSLNFADGAAEAKVTLDFPTAEVGKQYTISFIVEDPKYASKYATEPTAFDLTIVREKWNHLGKATYSDNTIWTDPIEEQVNIYQNDANKNQYRLEMKWEQEDGTDYGVYSDESDKWLNFWVLQKGQTFSQQGISTIHGSTSYATVESYKASSADLVYFDPFDTGVDNGGETIYVNHPSILKSRNTESSWTYNKVLQYQDDGKTPAGVQLAPVMLMMGSGSGWDKAAADEQITIVFPGAVLTDYSISVETGLSSNGELPVVLTLGTDVDTVKYAVFEGVLNSAQKAKYAVNIADGSQESSVAPGEAFTISLAETGVYTLVAVAFDAEGVAQDSATSEFSYVAKGDEVPVVLSLGIAATNKYAPQGMTSENSLEYYLFGADIKDIKVGLYKYVDIATKRSECVERLLDSDSLEAEDIEAVNNNGLVEIAQSLVPGTQYVLLVYASNGYQEEIFEASASTEGEPLPIYQDYSMDSINPTLLPMHKDGYFGTYNFYAVDEFGYLGLREYISQVTIEDSETPDVVAEDGSVDEFLNIKGIFTDDADFLGFDDTQEWDFYRGVLYNLDTAQEIGRIDYGGTTMYAHIYVSVASGNVHKGYPNMLIGGFVDEGYIAFASSELYNGGTLGENGLFLGLHSDPQYDNLLGGTSWFTNLLFVSPEVDSSAPASSAALQSRFAEVKARNFAIQKGMQTAPANYVLTPKARAHAIIDKVLSTPKNVLVSVPGEGYEPTSVKASAKLSNTQVLAPKADWTQTPAQILR